MTGGALKHTVTIERSTPGAVDDYNQPAQSFATSATVRALIQAKSGRERAQMNEAGAVRGEYLVLIPTADAGNAISVDEGDRLLSASVGVAGTYQIEFVANRGRHYALDCSKVAA